MWTSGEIRQIVFDHATEGILVHEVAEDGMPGKVVEVNRAGCTMTGYSREELLCLSPRDFGRTPPDVARKAMAELTQNRPVTFETVIVTKDGEEKPVEVSDYLVTRGKKQFVIAFIRDITERKKAEERLRTSEKLFRGAFENAAVGASMASLKGRFIKVNRYLCDLLGYTEEELLTRTFSDVTHPDDVEIGLDAGRKLVAGEVEFTSFEKRYVRKDGRLINVVISPTVIRDSEGVPQHFLALFQDVTERKKAEEGVRESLREKEVLLKEIHHRVKNNMNVITSLLMLQSRQIKDPDAVSKFVDIQNRIHAMALIHEILYRSENFADIHFEEYLKALAESLRSSLGGRSYRVEIVMDMDEIVLDADAAIPCGLIMNEIITNSFKYAFPEDGDGEVRITVRRHKPDGIVLKVADNGVGMPEGVDFDRPASLGLELIKTLAEKQLGGTIELNSDKGTEYTITFSELPYRTGG